MVRFSQGVMIQPDWHVIYSVKSLQVQKLFPGSSLKFLTGSLSNALLPTSAKHKDVAVSKKHFTTQQLHIVGLEAMEFKWKQDWNLGLFNSGYTLAQHEAVWENRIYETAFVAQ